jgi:glycerol-3-phosphate acyltransferase PlsX
MRAKIPAERTMQKKQSISVNALIAENLAFLIVFALIAATMTVNPFMEKSKNILPVIGIDLMGSDEDSESVLVSLLPSLEALKHTASFLLFGEEKNKAILDKIPHISYRIATDQIEMNENPLLAIRRKKNSSLHLGIRSLKTREIQAFISKGNTGALLAMARAELEKLPSISRPALITLLPTKNSELAVLDVGANTSYKSAHLIQFAAIGIAYQKARGVSSPKVGLLNIGVEPIKGTPELRDTYQKLSELSARHHYPLFYGNIEARDAFEGIVDVLVTDGFTGNIFLKTAEGMAGFVLSQLKGQTPLERRLDYSEYPGALLAGVKGIVIKCHGSSKPQAFHHSLVSAIHLVREGFLEKVKKELTDLF